MKIKEIKAKSIITKSGLPDSDFVLNPYVGCMHGCIYCYARFMKRFTNHDEPWGKFVDVKINAADLIPKKNNKYINKSITISSVSDPYQRIESKYKLMRKILTKLVCLLPNLCIMTKSDLILRDIDLLKKFNKGIAGFSLSLFDEKIRKEVEPLASPIGNRINALKELKKTGISTFMFISPMLPELTNWKKIILENKKSADQFWFENLNIKATNWSDIKKWLNEKHPNLLKMYEKIYFSKNNYWDKIEIEVRQFCNKNRINFKLYFHH